MTGTFFCCLRSGARAVRTVIFSIAVMDLLAHFQKRMIQQAGQKPQHVHFK